MTLYLVRHAQSAPSDDIPHPHWPLSELGQRQAVALAPFLERLGVEVVCSSTYDRAIATVAPYAHAAGLRVSTDADLRERDFSPEMLGDFHATVRRCFDEPGWSIGRGESNLVLAARMRRRIDAIRAAHPDRVVAIASHGQALSALLTTLSPSFGHAGWQRMGNPDVFALHGAGEALRFDGESLRGDAALPDT